MTKIEKVIKGLQILAKYEDCDIQSEHDQIYVGPTDAKDVSKVDAKELEKLDFFIDSEFGSWTRFV